MDFDRLSEINIPYSVLVFSKYDSINEKKAFVEVLKKYGEEYSKKYEKFSNIKVRTGDGRLSSFDRLKIKESLLKETDISVEMAEKISLDVQNLILSYDIKDLNTSLIRDFVNLVLLNYRLFNIRKQYLRIGMPSYDLINYLKEYNYNKIQEKILSDFVLSRYLPQRIVYSYLKNDLYFHGLPSFLNQVYYYEIDLDSIIESGINTYIKTDPPKYPEVFINQLLNYMRYNKKYVYKGFLLCDLNKKILSNFKNISNQVVQAIIYEFNALDFETTLFFNKDYENKEEELFVQNLINIKKDNEFKYPIIVINHTKTLKNFVLGKTRKGVADVISINLLKYKTYEDINLIIDNLEMTLKNTLDYISLKNKYFVGNPLVRKITEKYVYFVNLYGLFDFPETVYSRRIIRFVKKYLSKNKSDKVKIKLCYFHEDYDLEKRFGKVNIKLINKEKLDEFRKIDKNIRLVDYF